MITQHITAMIIGFLLDLCFGDPRWLPHPVRAMGWLISHLETAIRDRLPKTPQGERLGGIGLVAGVLSVTGVCAYGILWAAGRIHPILGLAVECIMCYQMLAARGLRDESMKVWKALKRQDVEGARTAVSMIVGRDTEVLSETGIIKAAVETVVENTSDGVIAPLFYMAFGGGPWAYLYKAVNTMDSMVGYKNEKYLHFGRTAARLDDLLNLIPSRLSALLMIAASFLTGMDGKGAIRIYRRDRRNHKSPNSAQTEAVCAGAFQVQLAGNAWYFGTLYEKPTIGDDIRPIEADDIQRANRLLYMTSVLAVLVFAV
ncbi:adenosylcobinamide-phosphate synthase CbiB, partial [Hungatella hathewayi]